LYLDPRASLDQPNHNNEKSKKMKTQDQSLYNSLACLVLLGKELKSTLEDLALALQKSEQILIAHNLKISTRWKK